MLKTTKNNNIVNQGSLPGKYTNFDQPIRNSSRPLFAVGGSQACGGETWDSVSHSQDVQPPRYCTCIFFSNQQYCTPHFWSVLFLFCSETKKGCLVHTVSDVSPLQQLRIPRETPECGKQFWAHWAHRVKLARKAHERVRGDANQTEQRLRQC